MNRSSTQSPTKVVAYVRVSTDKQADTGHSLDVQRAKLQAYADLYDLQIVRFVVDAGASAKTLKREGLQEALGLLKTGQAEGILVAKLDRLTRSVRDLDTLIHRFFDERKGYALLSVAEQIDTRSAGGRLVLNVLAAVSQWEREAISERTRAALQHKRSKGEKLGGCAPYGLQLAADGVTLEAHPQEGQIRDRILAMRADGCSIRGIARTLNAEQVPARGKRWHVNTITRIVNY